MTNHQAEQIAILLNLRNQLIKPYESKDILLESTNYVFIEEGSKVVACAVLKKVQWYQWEICHVSVDENHAGKGLGKLILKKAEKKALDGGAKILQCTVRSNNARSRGLFSSNGYLKTVSFFYSNSGNWVDVFQKSIAVLS